VEKVVGPFTPYDFTTSGLDAIGDATLLDDPRPDRGGRAIVKALHLNPDKGHPSPVAFRRALEQARPAVSWKRTPTVNQWHGEGSDGSSWRADIAQRRAGYRFEVARQLPARAWRRLAADDLDGSTET
jgi:hypothetical protein